MKSSKKITKLFLTLFVLVFAITALAACGEDNCTVTFDSNGGTAVNSVTVAAGEKVAAPATPVKEDYVFSGWEGAEGMWDFNSSVTSDMTLVAKWTKSESANVVSVTFNANGGTSVESVNVNRGTVLGAPEAPTKAGYIFAGWTVDGKAYDFALAVVDDTVLDAEWTIIDYSITYTLAGGTNAAGNPAEYNVESDTFTVGEPTRTGYAFVGWTFEGQETPVKALELAKGSTGNRDLTANWALVTYAITYNYNGGTGAEAPIASYNVTSDALAIPDPVKADYVFLGWTYGNATEPQRELVIAKGSTGDYALVANWAPVSYDINYDLDGGVNSESNPSSYTHESAITLAEPTKPGYNFLGWTWDGSDVPAKDVTIALGTKGELSYRANWEIVTYNITYNMGEGAQSAMGGILKPTFTVEDLPLYPESIFTMTGNTFVAWFGDEALTSRVDFINECGDVTLYASFAPATEGLVFTEVSYGYVVTAYNGESTVVYIPEIYNNLPVTAVAEGAFAANTAITEVYIPYGIQEIGLGAFSGCSSLTKVNVRPDGMLSSVSKNAFAACTSLEEITIPAGVEVIGENAFLSCLSLKEVNFMSGSQLKTVANSAFESCIALETITVPDTVTSIGNKAFYLNSSLTTIYFGDESKLNSIGKQAFYAATSLEAIKIPAKVTAINEATFQGDTSLTSVTFADGSLLYSIGDKAFYNCDALASIAIPDSVAKIQNSAFAYSDKLENVTFGENSVLETVGASAFYDCGSLKSLFLPKNTSDIADSAFYYCVNLEEFGFGEALQTIGRNAFYNCAKLTELKIPSSVYEVSKDAFRGCNGIKLLEVTDASNIKTIFGGSLPEALEEVVISSGSSIEANAFANCNKIHTITLPFVGKTSEGGRLSDIFGGSVPSSLVNVTVTGSAALKSGAFAGASSIKNLVLEPYITNIEETALYGCRNLENLTITLSGNKTLATVFGSIPSTLKQVKATMPASATPRLPADAFKGSYVETVILDARIATIGESAFEGVAISSVVIPDGSKLTSIEANAFRACMKLTSISFTNKELTIGDYAFAESAITNISFAESADTELGMGVFEGCSNLKSFSTVASGVTEIADYAFANCSSLEEIIISDAVTAIGVGAFENCSKLISATVGEASVLSSIGDYSFRNSGIKSFYIPDGIALIAPSAFENCAALEAVTFSDISIVTEIGRAAFANSGLKTMAIPATVEKIQESAFHGAKALASVTFAEGTSLTKISTSAFENCTALGAIAIPDGVSVIALNAFKNCKSLTSVTFGEASSLTLILAHAFENCSKLTAIAVPKGVGSIGEYAFAQNFSLASLTFAEDAVLEEIATYAFYNCDSLAKLSLPKSLKVMGERAFYTCSALTEVSFPADSVIETIPAYAFANCEKLAKVNIPDSVKTIATGAFSGCVELATLTIGETATLARIEASAFRGCTKLASFTSPASLEYIGNYAFAACSELTTVTLSVTIDELGEYVFIDCPKLTFKLNYSDEKLLPANWSQTWNYDARAVEWVDLTPDAPAV